MHGFVAHHSADGSKLQVVPVGGIWFPLVFFCRAMIYAGPRLQSLRSYSGVLVLRDLGPGLPAQGSGAP